MGRVIHFDRVLEAKIRQAIADLDRERPCEAAAIIHLLQDALREVPANAHSPGLTKLEDVLPELREGDRDNTHCDPGGK